MKSLILYARSDVIRKTKSIQKGKSMYSFSSTSFTLNVGKDALNDNDIKQQKLGSKKQNVYISNSLAEATRHGKKCETLKLSKSEDLICKNIMCEKLGEPCICRLARCLSFTPNVVDIDLSDNGLTNLPDTIYSLQKLQKIDLKGNSFSVEEKENIKEKLAELAEKEKLELHITI